MLLSPPVIVDSTCWANAIMEVLREHSHIQAFILILQIHIFECWFRPDQIFGVVAGDGNGFDFTFLLTFSFLFWCEGKLLQILCIAEGYFCLLLPALESKNLASYTLPRKSKKSHATAAYFGAIVFCLLQGLCKLHILLYSAANFLLWLPTHCNKLKD